MATLLADTHFTCLTGRMSRTGKKLSTSTKVDGGKAQLFSFRDLIDLWWRDGAADHRCRHLLVGWLSSSDRRRLIFRRSGLARSSYRSPGKTLRRCLWVCRRFSGWVSAIRFPFKIQSTAPFRVWRRYQSQSDHSVADSHPNGHRECNTPTVIINKVNIRLIIQSGRVTENFNRRVRRLNIWVSVKHAPQSKPTFVERRHVTGLMAEGLVQV